MWHFPQICTIRVGGVTCLDYYVENQYFWTQQMSVYELDTESKLTECAEYNTDIYRKVLCWGGLGNLTECDAITEHFIIHSNGMMISALKWYQCRNTSLLLCFAFAYVAKLFIRVCVGVSCLHWIDCFIAWNCRADFAGRTSGGPRYRDPVKIRYHLPAPSRSRRAVISQDNWQAQRHIYASWSRRWCTGLSFLMFPSEPLSHCHVFISCLPSHRMTLTRAGVVFFQLSHRNHFWSTWSMPASYVLSVTLTITPQDE